MIFHISFRTIHQLQILGIGNFISLPIYKNDNLFSKTAAYVQFYIKAAQVLVEGDQKKSPEERGSGKQVTSNFLDKQVFPKKPALGGLAFFKDCYEKKYDEDKGEDWNLKTSVKAIFFMLTKEAAWVENEKDIFYFNSIEEAVMAMQVTFGT